MIHCRPDTEACSPREIVGNAMFTIVSSSPIMNKLRQHMPRTARRRRRLSWGTATTFYSAVRLNSGQPPNSPVPLATSATGIAKITLPPDAHKCGMPISCRIQLIFSPAATRAAACAAAFPRDTSTFVESRTQGQRGPGAQEDLVSVFERHRLIGLDALVLAVDEGVGAVGRLHVHQAPAAVRVGDQEGVGVRNAWVLRRSAQVDVGFDAAGPATPADQQLTAVE